MKQSTQVSGRLELGRVSTQTQGPPGIHMELSGQWDKAGLTG
jgi:hypothetical protein